MDISKLSDQELLSIVGSGDKAPETQPAPQTTESTKSAFDSMSDEELLKIAGVAKDQPVIPAQSMDTNSQFEQKDLTTSGINTPSVFDDQPGKDFNLQGKGSEGIVLGMEGISRGLGRVPLGVAKLGGDLVSIFGTEEYANKADKWIKDNQKYIEDNGLEAEALFGEIAANIALPSNFIKSGLAKIGGAVAAETAVTALGSGDGYTEASLKGAVGGTLTVAGGAVVNKIIEKLGPTTEGTNYLLSRIVAGMPDEQAVKTQDELLNYIKTIPKEHQAYALANIAEGKMGLDNIRQAVKDDTHLEAILNNSLRDRKQIVTAITAGHSDVNAAQAQWSDMLKQVEEVAPASYSTEPLQDSLDYVSNIYGMEGTSKASQLVRQIKADTAEPALSASQALNVRKGINELIRKAPKGSREVTELTKVKDSLDNFIETTLPPEINQLVKDTTSEYARVVNNKKFTDIINKNTSNGIGVDWTKVLADSKKAGLNSEEVSIATNISKEFEKKFKYDKALSSIAEPSGIRDASGGLLFFLTMMSNKVRDITSPIFSRSRYENLMIQKEIINTIRKTGTSFTDTLTGLSTNKAIPDEFRLGIFSKLSKDFGRKAAVAGTAGALYSTESQANIPRPANAEVKNYFASIESGGKYDAYNESSKAYGKYQIHPVMMKDLGITKAYLKNPNSQEKVMDQLIPKYESRLKKFDIPVTKENMFILHNLGPTGGIRVLKGNYTKEDIRNMANNLPDGLDKTDTSSVVYNYSNRYKVEIPRKAI